MLLLEVDSATNALTLEFKNNEEYDYIRPLLFEQGYNIIKIPLNETEPSPIVKVSGEKITAWFYEYRN